MRRRLFELRRSLEHVVRSFVHDQLPSRVVFGAGSLDRLRPEVELLGAKRLLLINSRSATSGAERAIAILGELVVEGIASARPHVPLDEATAARTLAAGASVDGIVAVGGGSAIGLAKAVAVVSGAPIAAVPTTYSGSEMTPIYGITSEGHKRTDRSDGALPRTVLYDPELTTGLPPSVTGPSGMNALAHAIEALYANDSSPVVELFATRAIEALGRALPAAVAAPADLEARGDALYGAYLAGAALASAGMALHHRICHVLGGSYGLEHGAANSAVLPHVAAFNEPTARPSMAIAAAALEADHAPGALFDLASSMGAPTDLRSLGLEESALEDVARAVLDPPPYNPRELDFDSVVGVLRAAYAGIRPTPQQLPVT